MRKAGYRAAANAQNEQGKDGLGILMENHNGTGNNSGAAFGDPDVKGSPLAPYANGVPLDTAAHAESSITTTRQPSQPAQLSVAGEGTILASLRILSPASRINVT
jgi:hypothetical protein